VVTNNLQRVLLGHKPKNQSAAFGLYRLCRNNGIDPPPQVMKFMFEYLDKVSEQKHRRRSKNPDPVVEGYWEIDDRTNNVHKPEIQERVINEVSNRLGKDPDNYKRQYFKWREKSK